MRAYRFPGRQKFLTFALLLVYVETSLHIHVSFITDLVAVCVSPPVCRLGQQWSKSILRAKSSWMLVCKGTGELLYQPASASTRSECMHLRLRPFVRTLRVASL